MLAEGPHPIERGRLESQQLPDDLTVGIPVQMLSNRPDIRSAEYSLMQSYYATSEARSALYPSITLSGTLGWTNNSGARIVDPGKFLWSAAASLLQPIFNANANRAPGIVDLARNPILDREEVYSGCYCRFSVNFYPFSASGNNGVAVGLNNVQKVADGERLAGGSRAEDDFNDNYTGDLDDIL